MKRPLIAMLALSAILCTPSIPNVFAGSLPDGARGRAIFRLHGGALFHDQGYSKGPGWVAGGAFGVGVTRNLLIMASMEHIHVHAFAPYRESFQPISIQLEMGGPFQHRITPRLDLGGGLYLRTVDRVIQYDYGYPYSLGRTSAPFGMNIGGGISFPLGRNVMLDFALHRHGTFDSNAGLSLTTATAGMTFALSREEPGEWASTDRTTLASR